jgi:O-methyltransferase
MFWVKKEDQAKFNEAVDTLSKVFGYTFAGDMLITFNRNMGFFDDAKFMQAFNGSVTNAVEKTLIWRLHVLCWCALNSLRVAGDFVECGVFQGFCSSVATHYLDFGSRDKQWYLYDTFTGIPPDQLDPGHQSSPDFEQPGLYEAVVQRFAAYRNVHVLRGRVPEVLRERAPEKVAFMHLDMNSAAAEMGALEFFWERLSPGAAILLDDYGWRGYRAQKLAEDPFFAARGRQVLELPTGQGMVLV